MGIIKLKNYLVRILLTKNNNQSFIHSLFRAAFSFPNTLIQNELRI